MTTVDVVIVGGGPAGLSAALMLGRCRRDVVLVDAGEQRNRLAHRIHGYLTRDGTPPAEFLRLARAEVAAYPTVEVRDGTVTAIDGQRGAFRARIAGGPDVDARRVLLATGVTDIVPRIPGLPELFGRSVHHCPHCDGFEYSGRPVAVYGYGAFGAEAALAMLTWTNDVVLVTDGRDVPSADRARCERRGIAIRGERVARLVGRDGFLERVEFGDSPPLPRDGLFVATGQREKSPLAAQLGCEFTAEGAVVTDRHEVTRVPGVYVAGDAANGEQLVVVAAAEGVVAATKIHASLWAEELGAS